MPRRVLALVPALAVRACAGIADVETPTTLMADGIEARVSPAVVFLTMRIMPDASMDALFEVAVAADPRGCLRLASPDGPTAVWPRGYGYEDGSGAARILDASGELVGRVGNVFRLPGGEVPFLHGGLGFTAADQELADAQCPGRYWIVGID